MHTTNLDRSHAICYELIQVRIQPKRYFLRKPYLYNHIHHFSLNIYTY